MAKLTTKKTCARCRGVSSVSINGTALMCSLGFRITQDEKPLEPCYSPKPITYSQHFDAYNETHGYCLDEDFSGMEPEGIEF